MFDQSYSPSISKYTQQVRFVIFSSSKISKSLQRHLSVNFSTKAVKQGNISGLTD